MDRYEKLIGKQFILEKDWNGNKRVCTIVNCDRDIGLTIMDGDNYILCLACPSSPLFRGDKLHAKNTYKSFDAVIKLIENNEFSYEAVNSIADKFLLSYDHNASDETCSFNQ